MVVNCQEFEFVCNTTTGVQTIVSGLPFTPKGYILVSFYTTTNATFQEGFGVSVGFSDGTNSGFNSIASTDNEATAITGRAHGNNVLGMQTLADADTTTADGMASHSSFGAGSIVINWTNAPSVANRVFGMAFGGADFECEVKRFTAGTTSTGNFSYTTTMATPQSGFFMMSESSTTPDSFQGDGSFSLGVALSSTKRALLTLASEDGGSTMDTWRLFDNTKCCGALVGNDGTLDAAADFVSWDANGFTLNWTNAPSSSGQIIYAM